MGAGFKDPFQIGFFHKAAPNHPKLIFYELSNPRRENLFHQLWQQGPVGDSDWSCLLCMPIFEPFTVARGLRYSDWPNLDQGTLL